MFSTPKKFTTFTLVQPKIYNPFHSSSLNFAKGLFSLSKDKVFSMSPPYRIQDKCNYGGAYYYITTYYWFNHFPIYPTTSGTCVSDPNKAISPVFLATSFFIPSRLRVPYMSAVVFILAWPKNFWINSKGYA